MPLPPPPPPAPLSGPPPPPPPGLPAFGGGAKKGGNPDQARGQLLQSIRQGKTLKKTVTIDKSKPLINNSPKTPVSSNGTVNNVKTSSIAARTPIDLANLFAGGMPTLKPTGLRDRGQSSSPATPPINNNASSVSLFNQTTVNSSPSNINTVSSQMGNSRGPPPQPPPLLFHQKSSIHSSTSEPVSIIPPGVGHNRTVSVPSLVSESLVSRGAPPGGYGKPNVAPKPPSKKPTIPLKQPTNSSTNLVSRTKSLREPKTPPVVLNNQSLPFSNLTMHSKNQPAFHLSQDSILKNPDNLKNTNLGYRTLRPIKHPTDRPPPPPIKAPLTPPSFAPPPPPSHRSVLPIPPPPNVPPHKNYPTNNVSNGVPPTPPTRHSSMRNGQTSVLNESLLEQMEMRFSSMFKPLSRIPPPPVFQRVDKIYNSRLVVSKHRAPKPPGY